MENKVVLKDSIINNLNFQVSNFNNILSTKKSQLKFTEELNEKLRLDLKKQKLKKINDSKVENIKLLEDTNR